MNTEHHMTIEKLYRCRQLDLKRAQLEDRIDALRYSATGLSRAASAARGGNADPSGRLPKAVERIIEAQEDLKTQTAELCELRAEVEAWINTLPTMQGRIIHLRYIGNNPWKAVARSVHYTVDNCMKLHAIALKKLPEK